MSKHSAEYLSTLVITPTNIRSVVSRVVKLKESPEKQQLCKKIFENNINNKIAETAKDGTLNMRFDKISSNIWYKYIVKTYFKNIDPCDSKSTIDIFDPSFKETVASMIEIDSLMTHWFIKIFIFRSISRLTKIMFKNVIAERIIDVGNISFYNNENGDDNNIWIVTENKKALCLFEKVSHKSKVLIKLKPGDRLLELKSLRKWIFVKFDETCGWIRTKNLEKETTDFHFCKLGCSKKIIFKDDTYDIEFPVCRNLAYWRSMQVEKFADRNVLLDILTVSTCNYQISPIIKKSVFDNFVSYLEKIDTDKFVKSIVLLSNHFVERSDTINPGFILKTPCKKSTIMVDLKVDDSIIDITCSEYGGRYNDNVRILKTLYKVGLLSVKDSPYDKINFISVIDIEKCICTTYNISHIKKPDLLKYLNMLLMKKNTDADIYTSQYENVPMFVKNIMKYKYFSDLNQKKEEALNLLVE